MRPVKKKIEDSEEAKARARLLAHFVDHPTEIFYSRQLEVLFEDEYFHWVTNRALRGLIAENAVTMEVRKLDIGSEMKLVWNTRFRFNRRAVSEVHALVNAYTSAATDGTLGMQGEHLVLAAFARNKFVLVSEEAREYNGVTWSESGHDLDFIFERGGVGYGVEVKNTLGYMDVDEFVTKIRLARAIGVKPVFVVRALPRTWHQALVRAGGFGLIMKYQFYPWTHADLAASIRESLGLPVDTPKRIEKGTMERLEQWIRKPDKFAERDSVKVERFLAAIESANKRGVG